MAEETLKVMSMDPDDFIRGGLLNDVDVEVTAAVFCTWAYGRSDIEPVLALRMELKDMESGETVDQYWSAGAANQFVIIDEDGEGGAEEGPQFGSATKEGVNDSANVSHLFVSLKNNGFPRDELVQFHCKSIIGLQGHVVRNQAPKRQGLKDQPGEGDREKTILVFSKIIKMPGDKKRKAPKKTVARKPVGTKTTGTTKSEPEGDDGTTVVGKEVITALLEAEGSLELKKLKIITLRYMASNKVGAAPQRNPVAQMVANEEWLLENGYMVEDGTVMAGE
jgi:hypothetical protein